MSKPIIYSLTRYVKGKKKTIKNWGYYNEDTQTVVLCIGKNPDGSNKYLAKSAAYSAAVPGKPGEYTKKFDDLYEKTVPVFDSKFRKKVVKGYETDILSSSHTYLWYKFKK